MERKETLLEGKHPHGKQGATEGSLYCSALSCSTFSAAGCGECLRNYIEPEGLRVKVPGRFGGSSG
jgi:hypothetical protein